ncbi:MAG: HRDC domain-containing protein [Elusimicrobia bacterium]|jgi:ribonuclease D|nr:HRDC domain-containing protein [Elusimicrobiota bacterium]
MELAEEEFRDLARPLEIETVTPESTFLKMTRSRKLNKKQKPVLWKLIQIRDREAKKRDKPLFKVLADRLLLKVASELPRTKKALSVIKGMSPFNMSKFADKFLKIISSPGAVYPKPRRRKKGGWEYLKRLEKITKWRTKEGRKRDISSEFVLPRHLMETIARKNPKTLKAVKEAMSRFPYRIKLYAAFIKDLF